MTMPTKTKRRRSTKSLGYEGRSESVLTPAKRAPSAAAGEEGEVEEKEEEEVAAEVDVEATAGPREAAPFPPPTCEAAVSSLTSASRLLVGFSPPAGVAAAAAVEGEVRRAAPRGKAASRGEAASSPSSPSASLLVAWRVWEEEQREVCVKSEWRRRGTKKPP